MSKLLMKSLKADLPALAELIRSQGRGKDTVLAHITPKEAALLKRRGGSGTINPDTGLPEFEDDFGGFDVPDAGAEAETIAQFPEYYPTTSTGEISPRVQIGRSTPESLAQETAEYYPDLYPGGQLPPEGYGTVYTPTGQAAYAPAEDLRAYAAVPTAPGVTTPPQAEKAWYEKLGLSPKDLTRLGLGAALTGGLSAQNIARTRQAGQQAQAARGEMAAIGKPYQEAGAQLSGAAQRGELTPASQQALQAAQAQIAQGVATRGGVGATQAQTQLAALRNLMLENQYNFGLKVSQIGDSYALGAIKTGMEADRYLNQANQQFYGTLAQMLAPFITGAPSATPTRTA